MLIISKFLTYKYKYVCVCLYHVILKLTSKFKLQHRKQKLNDTTTSTQANTT